MSLKDFFGELNIINRGHWQHPSSQVCGCQGKGWMLADLDNHWYWCLYHGRTAYPVPEGSGGDRNWQRYAQKNSGLLACIDAKKRLEDIIQKKKSEEDLTDILNIISRPIIDAELDQDQRDQDATVLWCAQNKTPPKNQSLNDRYQKLLNQKPYTPDENYQYPPDNFDIPF